MVKKWTSQDKNQLLQKGREWIGSKMYTVDGRAKTIQLLQKRGGEQITEGAPYSNCPGSFP